MQAPIAYDITIYQGATFELALQYRDNTGAPINMSGYTIDAQLWNRLGIEKLADFSIEWTSRASGNFKLRMSSATTSGITEQGRYDVLVTEPGGDSFYLLEGNAFWNPGLSFRP